MTETKIVIISIALLIIGLLSSGHAQMPKAFGNAPTVSACGTSPSVSGTDMAGKITVGTGVVTSCLLTLSQTYSTSPVCVLTPSLLTAVVGITSSTTNSITIGASVTVASAEINYHCIIP